MFFLRRQRPRPHRDRFLIRHNSSGFGCLLGKCVYKEEKNVLLQLHRTLLISYTFFFSERTLLLRAREATYAAEGKFLHISASNMLTNVYTSPEGFGVGRQLL